MGNLKMRIPNWEDMKQRIWVIIFGFSLGSLVGLIFGDVRYMVVVALVLIAVYELLVTLIDEDETSSE